MECKEYLKSYRPLRLAILRLEDRIATEESQAERATSILTGMPRGGGGKFADELWAALADSKEIYQWKLKEALALQKEIEHFIGRVPGDINKLLLQLRYVDCLSWPEISDRMGYERTHIHRLHGAALEEARRVYENRSL